jgi:ankyrin repeat protein
MARGVADSVADPVTDSLADPVTDSLADPVTDPVADLDEQTIAFAHRMFDLARAGDTEELAANVAAGLPANLTNDKGDTLLILAAYHNHPDTVAALLEHGADPERVNDRGQTALAAAVFRKNPETVRTLLAAGADPASAMPTAEFFQLPEMAALLKA